MPKRFDRELGLILAWFLFPLVPVVLQEIYGQVSNYDFPNPSGTGPDPREWGWFVWIIMLGPLVGYGFLAGATMSLPDDDPPPRGRLRRLLGRRAVWVAFGPWWGALVCLGVYLGYTNLYSRLPGLFPRNSTFWRFMEEHRFVFYALMVLLVLIWAYSWLWPAWFAMRRAKRAGCWKRSLVHGIVLATTFIGSLFGSFWAATAAWRSYFFDPRIVRLLLVSLSLIGVSGCASTITHGQMRRRELFHALLVAWVIGLALMWRWWSRPRAGRPPAAPG